MSEELEALARIRKELAKHYDFEKIFEWVSIDDDLELIEAALKRNGGEAEATKEELVNE